MTPSDRGVPATTFSLKSTFEIDLTPEERIYITGILSTIKAKFPEVCKSATKLQKIVVYVVKSLELPNVLTFNFRYGEIVAGYADNLEFIPNTQNIIQQAIGLKINFPEKEINEKIAEAAKIFLTAHGLEVRKLQYNLYKNKLYLVMLSLGECSQISEQLVQELKELNALLPKKEEYLIASRFILSFIEFAQTQLELAKLGKPINRGVQWIGDILHHIENCNPLYLHNNVSPERLKTRLASEIALSKNKLEDMLAALKEEHEKLPHFTQQKKVRIDNKEKAELRRLIISN